MKRQQTVCAVSVNEAPLANDDMYKVVVGTRLDVRGIDSDSLISNDSDDIDIRNQPLVVDTQVVTAPQYAEIFTLQSDGGFTYQPASDIPVNEQGTLLDSFVYSSWRRTCMRSMATATHLYRGRKHSTNADTTLTSGGNCGG